MFGLRCFSGRHWGHLVGLCRKTCIFTSCDVQLLWFCCSPFARDWPSLPVRKTRLAAPRAANSPRMAACLAHSRTVRRLWSLLSSPPSFAVVRIRIAKPSDVPALIELLGQLFASVDGYEPDEDAQRRGLQMIFDAPDHEAVLLVAQEEDRVVGMANLFRRISTAAGSYTAHLDDLVVDQAHRGKGIGKQLLGGAEEWARANDCARMDLETAHDNTPAQGLYRAKGWSRTGQEGWSNALNRAEASVAL